MEVQRFLGMVMYLGKFLPNLSEETAPLRQLLENDVDWRFDEGHHNAIQKLKHLVTSSTILTYYALRITADASKSGLSAVLEQWHKDAWKPIDYASRVVTQSEQNYAQIEKETLAIVSTCERFHEYTHGRSVMVCSDHKPLKAIFSKPLNKALPRLHRLLLTRPVADTLSRAYLTKEPDPEYNLPRTQSTTQPAGFRHKARRVQN